MKENLICSKIVKKWNNYYTHSNYFFPTIRFIVTYLLKKKRTVDIRARLDIFANKTTTVYNISLTKMITKSYPSEKKMEWLLFFGNA